ncbi:GNAT family N-acetyltransferase [Pseudonocardia nigra]|uniref:GNAT family N-acetyltransferase n=1 Tax=Pseudonocardia nigra TaxID=1921578 RepID=UPI001C601236|nr:GNAT family N-acetyltransferase [Pseudonocardia nigra]
MDATVVLRERFPVDDAVLSALHAAAFGGTDGRQRWAQRLDGHSLTWVGAFEGERLVGFANVAWDGGVHAFLVDVMVEPERQGCGLGAAVVAEAVRLAAAAGCAWLHVDFVADLAPFYLGRCGFSPTAGGLIALR